MEHLSLEIFDLEGKGSKYAYLPEDASITITETSEVFASGDVWSHSFSLNIRANTHIFGTSGDMHGSRLHELINKRRARLWVEGLPLYLGYLTLGTEAEVDEQGNIEVAFESGQKTFEEMIEGAKANQVPMMSDVKIGMALCRQRKVSYYMNMSASATFSDNKTSDTNNVVKTADDETAIHFSQDGENDGGAVQQYPRMVFPKGTFTDIYAGGTQSVNCLNTDLPYTEDENGTPTNVFCNIALCYQKYGYQRKNEKGDIYDDYNSEAEAQRGYEYMPANRVNSAPNFFVIYWLRSLMSKLGIYVEENQMLDVEDLRRLFFVNTNCAYEEPRKVRNAYDARYGRYRFSGSGRIVPELIDFSRNINISESRLQCNSFRPGTPDIWYTGDDGLPHDGSSHISDSEIPSLDKMTVEIDSLHLNSDSESQKTEEEQYKALNSIMFNAYATSECFPNVDISEVIRALENGFGIRFLFSDDYKRVRIVLLRNIFRSDEIQNISCDVISITKKENNTRGFRMTYGNSEDSHFFYKGFADMLPHKKVYFEDNSDTHDYSRWDLNASYGTIIKKISAFDTTCFVTPDNGNGYGIKVDKDAKRYDELHPSLFEYAGFMDAEDGDCSGDAETIKEINVGFKPAVMNDVNFEDERNSGSTDQKFALFVDETMRPRRIDLNDLEQPESYNDSDAVYSVDKLYSEHGPGSNFPKVGDDGIVKPGEFAIASDMYATQSGLKATVTKFLKAFSSIKSGKKVYYNLYATYNVTGMAIEGKINEGYRLYLQDNYQPNDNGVCPIETHDWGLTLGIMRGSGSDAKVSYSPDQQDGEGNDTWDIVPGSSATSHPDTCDNYGRIWDYDGAGGIFTIRTAQSAKTKMSEMWPDSNFNLTSRNSSNYLTSAVVRYNVPDDAGIGHTLLFARATASGNLIIPREIEDYINSTLKGKSTAAMYEADGGERRILIEVDSSDERKRTLIALQQKAFGGAEGDIIISGGNSGAGVTEGRFSLKLRAEKPNPHFDSSQDESSTNLRYLKINNASLRRRGLCDTFYKEDSKFEREARIADYTVRMELAQLLAIDKTKKATVSDTTGFIRKIQYSVSNRTGLGNVTMEIMYI